MEEYELDPPNQRLSTIIPESGWHKDQRNKNAQYPPSQLSYEPVDYEEEADYSGLIGTSLKQHHQRRRAVTFQHNGIKLQSMPRQLRWRWITALVSALWMAFTTIFAFNCSLPKPFYQRLLPVRSEDALLILNILSHGTLLLLGGLTSQAFEAVRWALASSPSGVPAWSFLGLGRATGLLGVISVLVSGRGGFLTLDGHRFWGVQRVFLFLVNAIVGIALLSNISVVQSWRSVETIDISAAGLSTVNASIASDIVALDFWAWIYSLLPSPNVVLPVTPTRCTLANNCESYYFSGTIYNVNPPKADFTGHSEATIFIVDDSIGYLLEFFPPESGDKFDATAKCGTYGVQAYAYHICLQQAGNDLLAGLAYCPDNSTCMSDTSWTDEFNSFLRVAVSKLPATVVYSRLNDSLLDIIDVGTPEPVNYTPNDFFPFFEVAGLNNSDRSDLSGMEWVVTQDDWSDPYTNSFILMAMIAIPIAQFNDASWYGDYPDENCNTTGALALTSYRFNISPVSLYAFIAGSMLSLVWSVILLAICMSVQIPNSSYFPEVDFASKCVESNIPGKSSAVGRLLYPLGNATSPEVKQQLAETRFFVDATTGGSDNIQHIAIAIDSATAGPLAKGRKYN